MPLYHRKYEGRLPCKLSMPCREINLSKPTWPDIAFAVGKLSQHMHDPREIHLQAANKVLAYLKGSAGYGLLFKWQNNTMVEIFCEADFAVCIVNMQSFSGYCLFIARSNMLWPG